MNKVHTIILIIYLFPQHMIKQWPNHSGSWEAWGWCDLLVWWGEVEQLGAVWPWHWAASRAGGRVMPVPGTIHHSPSTTSVSLSSAQDRWHSVIIFTPGKIFIQVFDVKSDAVCAAGVRAVRRPLVWPGVPPGGGARDGGHLRHLRPLPCGRPARAAW